MPKLKLEIPHSLTQAEAFSRIQQFLPELKTRHSDKISDIKESWSGTTGTFKFIVSGFDVSGTIEVLDSVIVINGNLPMLALMFKSTIENTIREQADVLLKE